MKITKHAKKQKTKRDIQLFKVINACLKGQTIMRCPYTQRHIVSHKGTTVVLCPNKETVITAYPNDYKSPTKLADVLDFQEFKSRLRKDGATHSNDLEPASESELSYEQYMSSGKKQAA